jgi:hypothetical protein
MLRARPIRLPQLGHKRFELRLSPIREVVSLAIRQRQDVWHSDHHRQIENDRPHLHRGRYHVSDADLGLESMVTLCLAGPEAEKEFSGLIDDGSDQTDYQMARESLARSIANPLHAAAELTRYRDAAQRLVRSTWARHCLLAYALLRNGSLRGDEILGLASNPLSGRIRVVHAPLWRRRPPWRNRKHLTTNSPSRPGNRANPQARQVTSMEGGLQDQRQPLKHNGPACARPLRSQCCYLRREPRTTSAT